MKVARKSAAPPPLISRRRLDILGLSLIFCGIVALLSLLWNQSAPIPKMIADLERSIAGHGAYAIPVLLSFAGVMFLVGFEKLSFSHSTAGSIILFFVFVGGSHLKVAQGTDPKEAGGLLGKLVGYPLQYLLGHPFDYLFLALMTFVAIVLLRDQPFVEGLRQIHATGKAGAERLVASARPIAAEDAAQTAVEPIAKNGRSSTRRLPNADEDREERTTRVVQRSLGGRPDIAQHVLPLTVNNDDEEKRAASNPVHKLFNLTRPWGSKQQKPEAEAQLLPVTDTAVSSTSPTPFDELPHAVAQDKAEVEAAELVSVPVIKLPRPKFVLPPLTLLKESAPATSKRSEKELKDRIQTLEQMLEQFNIEATVVEVASGPTVTRYEISLGPGIKVSKIVSLADNIAMSLAAIDVRVEAPIPGKSAIGVEVPNLSPVVVSMRECLEQEEFKNAASNLTVCLGKDVAGVYKYADLTRMPHLLIGGSTNSGKSVCLNVLIASLVYRSTPQQVKLLMIDPKRVELSLWDGIPHLLHPVVKDVKQAAGIFRAALREMDRRYDIFAAMGTRNIEGYNSKVPESEKMPFLVLIVDELADLMMQQGPEVESSICRLAQLARATGIHLVLATQRPSVDIITGTIKANISSRIAFAVASQIDSRTILDMPGAERLIGRGDMLFMPIDASKPIRIQGCYLSEGETNTLVNYLKEQERPDYKFAVIDSGDGGRSSMGGSGGGDDEIDDAFLEQAVRLVVNNGQASTSMLQRRFRIGYTRAARIVEMMEERGIVGPLNGAKPREILISRDTVEQMFNPGGHIPSVDEYEDSEG